MAHWLLAKAYYANGELVETKKTLLSLLQIAPNFQTMITPWLDRIEKELKVSSPHEIK